MPRIKAANVSACYTLAVVTKQNVSQSNGRNLLDVSNCQVG